MSKCEALASLLLGQRICHRFYAPEEWLMINSMGLIETNDGALLGDEYGHFWTVDQEWKDGWGVHESSPKQPEQGRTFTILH